jgi:hypothetical protein
MYGVNLSPFYEATSQAGTVSTGHSGEFYARASTKGALTFMTNSKRQVQPISARFAVSGEESRSGRTLGRLRSPSGSSGEKAVRTLKNKAGQERQDLIEQE